MPSTEKPDPLKKPRNIYFWLKIIALIIGGAYVIGKVLGEYFYNLGVNI